MHAPTRRIPQLAIEWNPGSEQGGDNATPDALQSHDDYYRVRRTAESVFGHSERMDATGKWHDGARHAGCSDSRHRSAQGRRSARGERIAGHSHRDLHRRDDTRLVPGTVAGLPGSLSYAAAVAEP